MPIVRIEMFAGRTPTQKNAFTKAVTEAFVEHCGGTPQSVHVVFYDIERHDWGVNGKLVAEPTPAEPPKS